MAISPIDRVPPYFYGRGAPGIMVRMDIRLPGFAVPVIAGSPGRVF